MDYYKFKITNQPDITEVLIAFFSVEPFDMFQETATGFDAFIPAKIFSDSIITSLQFLQEQFTFSFEKEFIKGENWNKAWEANFHPVQVGVFCGIRADFHPPFDNVEHELIINPRMAFGTGHHETTSSVIELMQEMDFAGKRVLDYGCGTGILSILAARLGADHIVAVDIEEESYSNTIENCEVNEVDNVKVLHGTLEDVPKDSYGIVLANINRNVILNSLATLAKLTPVNGLMLISGFVLANRELMESSLKTHGFKLLKTVQNNNWLAMQCLHT